jgi:hypothetical protein
MPKANSIHTPPAARPDHLIYGKEALMSQSLIAAVLAPLPESEEQADTLKFRRQMRADLNKVREEGMRHVRDARIFLDAERAANGCKTAKGEELLAALHAHSLRQCVLLAPSEKDLRWKHKNTKWRINLPDAVKEAIALDEKRFAGGRA